MVFIKYSLTSKDEDSDYEGFMQYEGHTHLGNYVFCHFPVSEEGLRDYLRAKLAGYDCQAGLTRFREGNLCVKILANGSELLVTMQESIKGFLRQQIG